MFASAADIRREVSALAKSPVRMPVSETAHISNVKKTVLICPRGWQ